MAVIRRVFITEFKEIVVPLNINGTDGRNAIEDWEVLSPNKATNLGSFLPPVWNYPQRVQYSTVGWDDWGILSSGGKEIRPNDSIDSNSDGIPDYLSLDVDNDGQNETFGAQDFIGVVNQAYLICKLKIVDYYDQTKSIDEMYRTIATGNRLPMRENNPNGWVILGRSKPSFYYERCNSVYGGKEYSGRIPVSINYFDLDDIWPGTNPDGSLVLIQGDGQSPLQPIGAIDILNVQDYSAQSMNGFDFSFGPSLDNLPYPLAVPYIQDYVSMVVSNSGISSFGPMMRNQNEIATIKADVGVVNLHYAYRTDILDEYGDTLNNTNSSNRPFRGVDDPYYTLFPGIPEVIEFRDGAKDRWGKPRHAISRGFTISNTKYSGKCIPILGETVRDTTITTVSKEEYRTYMDSFFQKYPNFKFNPANVTETPVDLYVMGSDYSEINMYKHSIYGTTQQSIFGSEKFDLFKKIVDDVYGNIGGITGSFSVTQTI